MDNWVDYDDGLLNGMKDHCCLPAPDFGDNLETKPLLEDIDSYLNKNSALITSKEKAEESVGTCNLPISIKEDVPKQEGSIPSEKCLDQGHMSSTAPVDNNIAISAAIKQEPDQNSAMNVVAPVMVAPGIFGFDGSVRQFLKPIKRGRPRIHPVKPDTGIKRKPGRPRIHPVKPSDGIKRKPGRPRIHPQKLGADGKPRRPPVSTYIRHIRPKPDPSLMVFAGGIPHTFIPTTVMNSIQVPLPQQRAPTVRFLPPVSAIDPLTGKRKRGRPRIHPVKIHDGIKRKPGRPRKIPLPPNTGVMIKMVPPRVFQHDTALFEKQFCPSSRSSELVEKVDVVEDKDRRFSIEAAVPESECKPFMCGACGDCFRTSEELMSHVVKHEEEEDDIQQGEGVEDKGESNQWTTDVPNQRESIDNGKDSPSESPPKPQLNYGEHMRKLAKLSHGTNAYSIDTQQHEQQANTSRNIVTTCS